VDFNRANKGPVGSSGALSGKGGDGDKGRQGDKLRTTPEGEKRASAGRHARTMAGGSGDNESIREYAISSLGGLYQDMGGGERARDSGVARGEDIYEDTESGHNRDPRMCSGDRDGERNLGEATSLPLQSSRSSSHPELSSPLP